MIPENIPWIFIGRTDVEAIVPWSPNAKSWLSGKDPDAGKYWREEEKRTTENEMVGWHHWLNGCKFAPGDGEGQGSLGAAVHGVIKSRTRPSNWTTLQVWLTAAVWLLSRVQLFCDPMDSSPQGSSDPGLSEARILEWISISSSRGSFWPRDQTVTGIGRQILYHWATWGAHDLYLSLNTKKFHKQSCFSTIMVYLDSLSIICTKMIQFVQEKLA